MAVPVLWRTQKQRYSLQAEVCPHCTSAVFPPRNVCPYCRQSMAQPAAMEIHKHAEPSPVREFVFALQNATSSAVAVAGDD